MLTLKNEFGLLEMAENDTKKAGAKIVHTLIKIEEAKKKSIDEEKDQKTEVENLRQPAVNDINAFPALSHQR